MINIATHKKPLNSHEGLANLLNSKNRTSQPDLVDWLKNWRKADGGRLKAKDFVILLFYPVPYALSPATITS